MNIDCAEQSRQTDHIPGTVLNGEWHQQYLAHQVYRGARWYVLGSH